VTAAFRAIDRSDLSAAAELLDRALYIMPKEDPRLIELTVERVDVLTRLGSLQDAANLLATVRDLPAMQKDPRQRAWWELAQLRVAYEAGAGYEIDAALLVIQRAIPEFERTNDIRGLGYAWLSKAHAHWWQLQAAATFAALERALTYSRQAGRRSQELSILDWVAATCWAGPSPVPDALAQLERIRQAADGDRRIEASVRLSRAKLFGMAGRRVDAERELGAALVTYAELSMAVSIGEVGEAGYWLGLETGALEQQRLRLEDGNKQLEATGAVGLLSTNLGSLAFVLLDLGKPDEAERVARRGLSIASSGDVSAVVSLRMAVASVEAQGGSAGHAAKVADELIALLTASDCHPIVGDWLSRAAQIHLAAGNRERAISLFGEALRKYRQKGADGLTAVLMQRMASVGIEPSAAK
jgi:tetratricopeptide (TPR) repeat protein